MRYCTPTGAPGLLCPSAREASTAPISTEAAAPVAAAKKWRLVGSARALVSSTSELFFRLLNVSLPMYSLDYSRTPLCISNQTAECKPFEIFMKNPGQGMPEAQTRPGHLIDKPPIQEARPAEA